MNPKEFSKRLKELNACEEAIDYLETNNYNLQEAWDKCERGDWMLWLYARLHPKNRKEVILVKGHCANTIRHLMKDERSVKAVDAAIAFGEGKITEDELNNVAISDSASAETADTYIACIAVYAAANTSDITEEENLKMTADICRKYLTI